MAVDLLRKETIEPCTRIGTRRWVEPCESSTTGEICSEWLTSFICRPQRERVRPMPRTFRMWPAKSVRKLAYELTREILARADVFLPVMSPSLQSALATVNEAKNLTQPELFALNAVIGRASIQNEFDIEALFDKEYEID